jgi:hypothetical protein
VFVRITDPPWYVMFVVMLSPIAAAERAFPPDSGPGRAGTSPRTPLADPELVRAPAPPANSPSSTQEPTAKSRSRNTELTLVVLLRRQ